MPEGPELATSRDHLRKILVGRKIATISVIGGRFSRKPPEGLDRFLADGSVPRTITSVDTKGKFMWWTIGGWKMWCTYGMSGQWSPKKLPHAAIQVDLDSSTEPRSVFFCDQRRFGTLKFTSSPTEHAKKLKTLGPDILGNELTPGLFAEKLLVKPERSICEALMDQSCISGVGNYIRAEALWLARVDPWRPVGGLTSRQLLDLYDSTTSVAKSSYSSGGATIHTYVGVGGEEGTFSSRFVVYARDRDADGNNVLTRKDSNGRTVHWSQERQH